jgi:6-phosphogluconolactonase (cycloisomerase 2 family)
MAKHSDNRYDNRSDNRSDNRCNKRRHRHIYVFFATNPGVGEDGATTPVCPGVKPAVPQDNSIVMLKNRKSGKLKEICRKKTGGLGTGPGLTFCEDSLASQGSICLSNDNRFLFAVNAGINDEKGPIGTVSSLRICHNGLKLVDNVSSYGTFPNACASYCDLLYVLNAGDNTNLVAYRIGKRGKLHYLGVKATFNFIGMANGQPSFLFEFLKTPSQVTFTPDGRKLVVSVKQYEVASTPPGFIYVFDVHKNGDLTNMVRNDSVGLLPWGFSIKKNYILSSQVIGKGPPDTDPVNKGSCSSYKINHDNTLTTISANVANNQTAPCWTTTSGRWLYVANTRLVPGVISKYEIKHNGEIVLADSNAFSAETHFLDISATERYLYILCPGALAVETGADPVPGSIKVLKIDKRTGELKLIQTIIESEPLTGLIGIIATRF